MPTPPTPPMLRPSAMPWWLAIVAVALAPLVVDSGLSMNLMAQFGIAVVACLCHHGARSQRVASFLAAQGFTHVANIAGGIDAWSAERDPRVPRY